VSLLLSPYTVTKTSKSNRWHQPQYARNNAQTSKTCQVRSRLRTSLSCSNSLIASERTVLSKILLRVGKTEIGRTCYTKAGVLFPGILSFPSKGRWLFKYR
jgi:hypothetical protein